MTGPLDAVTAIHNAFRLDMAGIDTAALGAARGEPGLAIQLERFRFLNEILVWHAHGEELAVFPALEAVAPSVAEAYVQDHRGLDAAFEALNAAVSSKDRLQTARAAAAFKFHLDLHLAKEDTHLYRLMRERLSLSDQGKAVAGLSSAVPQDRFPEVVKWMFPLMGNDDRENMARGMQAVMPAPVFAGVKALIRGAIGEYWAELVRRVPTLA